TWTVASETQLPYIEALRSLGFEWVWMDSDRGAAYDAVIARDAPVKPPLFVDAFEVDGRFRALEAITGELRRRRAPLPRAPLPLPRRPAARLRIAPPPFRRPAWAGVAAFAAAAAAAGGAYLAGAFAPSQTARVSLAHRALPAQLPVSAVFVPGKSLGGIALGATEAEVRAAWGHRFTVCQGCTPTTWFYMSPTGDPFGAGVSFRHGRVTAVFTLGSPRGWHMPDGVRVGQLLSRFNDPDPSSTATACSGYGAISTPSADAVSSILTIGQAAYGFALTPPSDPVCHRRRRPLHPRPRRAPAAAPLPGRRSGDATARGRARRGRRRREASRARRSHARGGRSRPACAPGRAARGRAAPRRRGASGSRPSGASVPPTGARTGRRGCPTCGSPRRRRSRPSRPPGARPARAPRPARTRSRRRAPRAAARRRPTPRRASARTPAPRCRRDA